MTNKVDDWVSLAWMGVHKINNGRLSGADLDDLFQCAMIGIHLASLSYDEDRGVAFAAHAYGYIRREIYNFIYKQTTDKDRRTIRVPRIQGEEGYNAEEEAYDDDLDGLIWADEFLGTVPLDEDDKLFFLDMVNFGDTKASSLYRQRTGATRQRAHYVKTRIRKTTEEHLKRLEER